MRCLHQAVFISLLYTPDFFPSLSDSLGRVCYRPLALVLSVDDLMSTKTSVEHTGTSANCVHAHTHTRAHSVIAPLPAFLSSALMSSAGQAVQQSYLQFACLHWKLWADAESTLNSGWFDKLRFTSALQKEKETATLKDNVHLSGDFCWQSEALEERKGMGIVQDLDGMWVEWFHILETAVASLVFFRESEVWAVAVCLQFNDEIQISVGVGQSCWRDSVCVLRLSLLSSFSPLSRGDLQLVYIMERCIIRQQSRPTLYFLDYEPQIASCGMWVREESRRSCMFVGRGQRFLSLDRLPRVTPHVDIIQNMWKDECNCVFLCAANYFEETGHCLAADAASGVCNRLFID